MIGLVSLNYKIAPLKIREHFYLFPNEISKIHALVNKKVKTEGFFVISTCNRTEIYFEVNSKDFSENQVFHSVIMSLSRFKKFNDGLRPYIKKKKGIEKITKHIFRLSSGLESMIIGEFQIVDQIKSAYSLAKTNKMLSPTLERMIQKSLEVSKFIRNNTSIDKGGVSVSSAAIDQIGNIKNAHDLSILCVGAGRTSKLSIQQLISKKFKNLFITNRTKSNVDPLIEKFNLKYVDYKNWKKRLKDIDIVIFSTSSKTPLIKDDDLSEIDLIRSNKITFVDLSVPRNIKLKKKYKNVDLVDLDKLKDQVNRNYNKRISEIKKAESMLMKHTSEFNQWVENRELRPAIISIKKQFDQLISNSPKLNGNKKEVEEIYEKFSDKIIKNLIAVTNNGKNSNALEIINKIFSND
tara:strand:- start:134 stop:1357 length:1224 start_codon:yes stop_codon:yes gene_type:complete